MVSNHQTWNGKNVVVDLITVRTFVHGHAWNTSMDYKFLGAHGPDKPEQGTNQPDPAQGGQALREKIAS